MKLKFYLFLLTLCCIFISCSSMKKKIFNKNISYHPFDQRLYKEKLNQELCQIHLNYLNNNDTLLLTTFLDAGARVPRGILTGNNIDMGNFYQCLGIKEEIESINIEGKYCAIKSAYKREVTDSQHSVLEWSNFDVDHFNAIQNYVANKTYKREFGSELGTEYGPRPEIENLQFTLGFCIPASCTSKEAIDSLLFNPTSRGIIYVEQFCRLPNDKQWVPVDYVAIVVFSLIGVITCISTGLDIYNDLIIKKGSFKLGINPLYFSFSVFTNSRRLLTFKSGPDTLECVDGVRALAMVWVIMGHTFYSIPFNKNPIETYMWSISPEAIWMISGHITVDTFFTLSGLLIVYTTAGKINGGELLKNLHLFFLNRLLRMFPILAAAILFEASLYNRIADGPFWVGAASNVLRCREYWWSALLHIQNYVNPRDLCVGVTWYLSVDVQLHILSPIVLYWVLSTRKATAWIALIVALFAVLTSSTIYIFVNNFPSGIIAPSRTEDLDGYFVHYYINSLTRASPFFVGMIFGYMLHIWRGREIVISKIVNIFYWCGTFLLMGSLLYAMHLNIQPEWNNQLADNLINSFLRSLWAVSIGWIILASTKGYGGPINWLLSLKIWKLPARVSYAMYIIHYSIMISYYYSVVDPLYFSVSTMMFNFFSFFSIVLSLAIVITIVIDSPFSTIFKVILKADLKRHKEEPDKEKGEVNVVSLDVKTGVQNPMLIDERNKLSNNHSNK